MSKEDKVSQLYDQLLNNTLLGNTIAQDHLALLSVTNTNTTVSTTTTDGPKCSRDYGENKKKLCALSGGNNQILMANSGVWETILSSAHEKQKVCAIEHNWILLLSNENQLMRKCFTKSCKWETAKFQIVPDRLNGLHRRHGLGLLAFLTWSDANLKAQAQQYHYMDNAIVVTVCDQKDSVLSNCALPVSASNLAVTMGDYHKVMLKYYLISFPGQLV